jgi:nitroreductase
MHLDEVVRRRRMVRRFLPTTIDEHTVNEMLDLARRGPSAGNSQGVDFVVLVGAGETERFWGARGARDYWEGLFPTVVDAPVVVIPLADAGTYLRRYSEPDKAEAGLQEAAAWPVPYWLTDTAMATMTLLLAAVDAGLGALFFGLHPSTQADVIERLSIPAGHEPIGVVVIGHPADERPTGSAATRARRAFDEVVHRGGW